MQKKIHTLHDIEKILTWVPPLFFAALMVISALVAHAVFRYQERSEITLLTQQTNHFRQNRLEAFVRSVNHSISSHLTRATDDLKRSVHVIQGAALAETSPSVEQLRPLMHRLEVQQRIRFVLFDRTWHIHYGQAQLDEIARLIFNRTPQETQRRITQMYLASQGDASTMMWKNDLDQTIQMSYMVALDSERFLGAFSRIDNLHTVTREAFVDAIRRKTFTDNQCDFWLFDSALKRAFNLQGNREWLPTAQPDTTDNQYTLDRYFLTIGITPKGHHLEDQIERIHRYYQTRHWIMLLVIGIVGVILIAFSALFSSFIRGIIFRFNMRLKRTTMRLKRLKDRYELAVIASNDGFWDTNFKTRKTYFSRKWLDLLGYCSKEIKTYEDWIDLIHPDDKERVIKALEEYKHHHANKHLICEYRLRTRSGDYLWMLGRGKVFDDKNGRPHRLLMMSMDISKQKETSDRLARLVDIEVLKNQEKQKLLIQQNKLAAMGEMIGAIAHQWRQPLNNVTLILHFIRDNIHNESFTKSMLTEYVARAKKQIDFMSETIDAFRDFYQPSKLKTKFDVWSAIESTLSIIQAPLDKNNIKVTLTGKNFHAFGHKNEFRQAILNILTNAKDAIVHQQERHSIQDGFIRIELRDHTIRIENNGGTIDEGIIDRIFEPYFTTKFEDKGTGIGLYMTRTIIENNMHGDITVHNTQSGVVFVIRLPHNHKEPL